MARILRQPSSLAVLAQRPYRRFWIGQTVSALGDTMLTVAAAFAALEVAGTATAVGVVTAAGILSSIVASPIAGVWADRLSRKQVAIAADLIRLATQAAVAALLLTEKAELWHLIALTAIAGAARAAFTSAVTGLVRDIVDTAHLQEANALAALSRSVLRIVGPPFAGLVVVLLDTGWAYAIDAATFAVSALLLSLVAAPGAAERARSAFLADLASGWRAVTAESWLVASLFLHSFVNLGIAAYVTLGPVISDRELGGAGDWGLIVGAAGVGAIAGSSLALRWKPRRPLLAMAVVQTLASLQLVFLIPPLPTAAIAVASAAGGFATGVGVPLWQTVVQTHVPQQLLARVSSWDVSLNIVLFGVGLAIVGPVSDQVGTAPVLLASAVVVVMANAAMVAVPSVRRLGGKPPEPISVPDARR
jgi:MFS family permease